MQNGRADDTAVITWLAVFMLETLKLSQTLKSSQDDFNVLDNFNVSSIKTAIVTGKELQEEISRHNGVVKTYISS